MGKKVRSRAAAEKVVGNINMLWEILIRVSLKPLVRLKCVSKQWQTLISDQQFRDSHSLHHQQRQRYKVVSVAASMYPIYRPTSDWVFHVYTFKTRSRIGRGVSVSIPFALNAAKGVYYNGAIHWCNKGEFSVYFDVDNQCLKNYPMPESDLEWSKGLYYFGESVGHLYLMLPGNSINSVYDIFELKEDYSGWSLRLCIDLNPVRVEFPQIVCNWHVMRYFIFHTAKGKEKKSSMLVLIVSREGAIFYDPVDKTCRKLCDFEMGSTAKYLITSGHVLPHFENIC